MERRPIAKLIARGKAALRLFVALLPLIFIWRQTSALAQLSTQTRLFRPAGTYAASVSVSPGGSVVCKSGDSATLVLFDGYNRRELPLPEESAFRAYQSRSGQVWLLAPSGVWLFHGGQWTLHSIPEIANEFRTYPTSQLHQIGLLPAEIDHLLILLHDRLLDYDASKRQVRILRESRATRLGDFSEIQEGSDESIWISGTCGIAHLQGPARRITPQTLWGEYLLPNTNLVNSLQRPFEGPPGTVTACASPADKPRSIVQWKDDQWTIIEPGPEKIRQAWGGVDGTIWAYSANSLLKVIPSAPAVTFKREPVIGSQYDMAGEANGVFWIASSEGLVRHAPFLWRSRPDLEDLQTAVHSLVFSGTNLWLAAPQGLISAPAGGPRQLFPWPEEIENLVPPRESVFVLNDGRLLISAQSRPFVFDPQTRAFARVRAPRAVQLHLLGQMTDGSIFIWLEHNEREKLPDFRAFDGHSFAKIELAGTNWPRTDFTFAREFSPGDLWIGCGSNLVHMRRGGAAPEIHGADQGLGGDRILTLAAIGDGRVWCGTSTRVYEFRGRRWEPVLSTVDRVTAIVPAAGSIWVGTASGLYRYFRESWIPHGPNEGMPAGAVYALRQGPNFLWAGTSRGVLEFHPEADPDPPHTLAPTVQDAQKLSTLTPTLVSFHGQDKWDYTPPSDLLFSYKLDEGGWTPFSNVTSRTFQNLSAGDHAFEVIAMDRNGNRAPFPAKIEFAVIVPWFRDPRLLAVSLLALVLIFVFGGVAVNKHFQLKRSYAEVESIVAQRTRELERANRELLHSQKMRAIGTMAAGIAHDFNNILSIIKGSAQIIESHVEDKEKIRTRVSRIQTVVEQGSAIVKALLGLGRANEQDLAPCDIGQLLNQTRKLLGDRFPESIQIHIESAPELEPVLCSEEVLQQMLLNFILNAAEAMGNRGMVQLAARISAELPAGVVLEPSPALHWVLISVADEGSGITSENLPRIFEPFFTTKAFSTRRGTGLGLSMVYELAKGLGYGLAVVTRPGEGSTFTIILPAH